MNNLVFIGKYSLHESFQTAGSKRVINQIKYLENYYEILTITLSPKGSNYNFNINLKSNEHKNIIDFFRFIFYWFVITYILIKKKGRRSYLILESVVEFYSCVPVIVAKILGYKIIHDVVEDFSIWTVDITNKQKITSIISREYEKRINKYCSGIIIISQKLNLKFQHLNIPILKLYNSVQDQAYTFSFNVPDKFIFFYSGSFGSKDGVKDLIDAFELVCKIRENVYLRLVGKGYGKYYEECLLKIKGNEKISYLGYLSEDKMIQELRSSHVLCVTKTNSEYAHNGFPFKLAEYLSFGLPVLTTTVSDIPLILTNDETVFFAIPEDIDSIAKTMDKIISNYNMAIQVGKKGRDFCMTYFSIQYIGSQLHNFIESLE